MDQGLFPVRFSDVERAGHQPQPTRQRFPPLHGSDRCTSRCYRHFLTCLILLAPLLLTTGCTSLTEYVHNGFKVGPNYNKPPAPVAKEWIDANDKRVRSESDDLSKWWTVLNDPVLDDLICDTYRQNLTLRAAGMAAKSCKLGRNWLSTWGTYFRKSKPPPGTSTRSVD